MPGHKSEMLTSPASPGQITPQKQLLSDESISPTQSGPKLILGLKWDE